MSPAAPSPASGIEGRLTDHLARSAAALAVTPAQPAPLIARSRARRRRRRAAGSVAGTAVLLLAAVVLVQARLGSRPESEEVHTGASPPGQPEVVRRQWPPTPLRLGLPRASFPTSVLEVRDADWTPGPRPTGPPGVVHQRLRPSFERFEGPTIDLVAVPGGPWPGDADLSAAATTLAGALGQLWPADGNRVRAAWRDAAGRTVTATAVGLPLDDVRAVLQGLTPLADGRYTVDESVALTTVLDLSDPPLLGATSLVRFRVGSGPEPPAGDVSIEVTLGDRDAFEAGLGAGGEWRTVPVGEHVAAASASTSEVRWYDARADAIVRVAAPDADVLTRALDGLGELSEDEFQALRHQAPGAGGG